MGYKRRIVVDDKAITEGAGLTLKQSLIPCGLGTLHYRSKMEGLAELIRDSNNPLLPLGFRVRVAGCFELAFSKAARHRCDQSCGVVGCVLWRILLVSFDHFGMDFEEIWVPGYFHDR